MADRVSGTVKFFNDAKGFGFIERQGQSDVFLHVSALPKESDIGEGDRVSFEVEQGPKGLKATNVQFEF